MLREQLLATSTRRTSRRYLCFPRLWARPERGLVPPAPAPHQAGLRPRAAGLQEVGPATDPDPPDGGGQSATDGSVLAFGLDGHGDALR